MSQIAIPSSTLHPSARAGVTGLAVRGLRNIRRLPSTFVPSVVMPIFQTIAFSGAFAALTQLPGFPTSKPLNWFMPLAVCLGSSFAGVGVGFSTIRDIESGFYDRLRMSPTPRRTLLMGPVVTALIRSTIVTAVVAAVGLIGGARLTNGPLGLLPLLVAGWGMAVTASGWGLGLAYRFRDMRGAAIMQLSLFVFVFLSTAQAPLSVMEGWLHSVARVNPMTNVLRLARSGFMDQLDASNIWGGLVALVVMSALTLTFAARGLQRLDR
jgi:ABC-2 type transport system permease protein